jgi:hypothetical protein
MLIDLLFKMKVNFGIPKLLIINHVVLQNSNNELAKSKGMDFQIAQAKKDFEESIRLAAKNLSQFRISKEELKELVL